MAHWQLGQKEEARRWYDRAVEWMEENAPNNEECRRFQAEAATLLTAPEETTPGAKEVVAEEK